MEIRKGTQISMMIAVLLSVNIVVSQGQQLSKVTISPDNVCTFHIADRLFSLIYLQASTPYSIDINPNEKIQFNFCHSFLPAQCQSSQQNQTQPKNTTTDTNSTAQLQAFAFHIKKQVTEVKDTTTNETKPITKYTCTPYTSNSYLYYFEKQYIKHNAEPQLILNLTTINSSKATQFHIFCSDEEYFDQKFFKFTNNNNLLHIAGESAFGCPVFQISSLWSTLQEHQIILGVVIFALGFQLLFYGLLMINVTVFIAGYFISFAIYGGIFTVFLGPDTSTIVVYFSLLFILLASTLTAYGLTRLINVSIFFIGAFFGLILGALVNTIFSSIFSIHSVWSLVAFEILFTIPFGLMTFRYANEIIILSTSLTGSYLIIRPISWLAGGFPNEFLLYQMYQSRQLSSVPWTFYLYLLLIIIHAFMGGSYQYLKLQRQDSNNTIMTNAVTQNIEQPLDKIKQTVDKLIARYSSSDSGEERYRKMKEMENQRESFEEYVNPTQYGNIQKIKQRNSNDKKGRSSKQDEYF